MIRLALALSLTLASPAQAAVHKPLSVPNHEIDWDTRTVTIKDTNGGVFETFAIQFWAWRAGKFKFVVAGQCHSACTMVLSSPDACAMPNAVFGFHQVRYYNLKTGKVGKVSEEATAWVWERYPEKVKARLGTLTANMVYMKGTELLPPCEETASPTRSKTEAGLGS